MPSSNTEQLSTTTPAQPSSRAGGVTLAALLIGGLALRLFHAGYRFLNADEVLHYILSVQKSFSATYGASLTTAHPPLLIIFLHYWGMLGHSELFLRLPSVLAGTGFCWVMYRWLRLVVDEATARLALTLLLFSPALILLSAEVRQYALLLLFSSLSLYFLESAIQRSSVLRAMLSAVALYLALLTHYSSFIVALTLGINGLLRFVSVRSRFAVFATWIAGQLGALGLVSFLFVTHISKLETRGAAESIAESYLRRSVFQPGENHVLTFIARSNLRLFHYFFSQGAVGVLALLLFVVGAYFLFRDRKREQDSRPPSWQFASILVFPLAANCALAIFRLYPYGGTRHNSYLSIFVFPAIAVAITRWKPQWRPQKLTAVALVLAVCNLFPAPIGEYIHLRDQNRLRMAEAVKSLQRIPAGSVIFTDDQGGLLLSYYLCNQRVVQIENPQPFLNAPCGRVSVVSIDPREWIFKAGTFGHQLRDAQQTYQWNDRTTLWFFQAGWFIDKESALREELRQYGCVPGGEYGHNITLCQLKLGITRPD